MKNLPHCLRLAAAAQVASRASAAALKLGRSQASTLVHLGRCYPAANSAVLAWNHNFGWRAGRPFAAGVLLALALWLGAPLPAICDPTAAAAALPQLVSSQFVAAPAPGTRPPLVAVNRHAPVSAPPPGAPVFSAAPTEEEIFRAAIFEEPLVPVGRKPTVQENQALGAALAAYLNRSEAEDYGALSAFLDRNPNSPWRVAVLVNLGIMHFRACRFSQTFPAWEEAWRLGKDATNLRAKALVDRAVGELAQMNAQVGRMDRLERLFAELGPRVLVGPGSEMMAGARAGLHRMKTQPWLSFRCGPLALDRIQAWANPANTLANEIYLSRSTTNGLSLTQVRDLARQLGMGMRMARRTPGAWLILPAVVNWKVGHYAALVGETGGRIHVQDSTFGSDLWITRQTLDDEASGFFLVAAQDLPAGWREVGDEEGRTIFGKGDAYTKPKGYPQQPPRTCQAGMTAYSFDPVTVSLFLTDTPVGYTPPMGPPVKLTINYQQREENQPANFSFSNFGSKWTFNWTSYVNDDPGNTNADVNVYLPGGGADYFTQFNPTNNTFAIEMQKRTVLTRTSSSSYTMLFPDGSQHIFSRPVGVSPARQVFLTRMIDERGNALDLIYDATNRLTAIRDSLGQVSTLAYGLPGDVYKVTQFTDPFGRFASFQYDSTGRLTNITDVIGISSRFTYDTGDFIQALITPYGTSRFSAGTDGSSPWLEMTDPEGATERVEYRNEAAGIPFSDPAGVPSGMGACNQYIWSRNTFYWDKKAFQEAAGDYTRAHIYHWLHDVNPAFWSPILESEKQPLENRVWNNYPSQPTNGCAPAHVYPGMMGKPSKKGRMLDDGTTQLYQYEYNDLGNVTKVVDPLGRTTSYAYATNLIDLLEVRQIAGVNDLLEFRTYNSQHLPLTVADGSGHTNTGSSPRQVGEFA